MSCFFYHSFNRLSTNSKKKSLGTSYQIVLSTLPISHPSDFLSIFYSPLLLIMFFPFVPPYLPEGNSSFLFTLTIASPSLITYPNSLHSFLHSSFTMNICYGDPSISISLKDDDNLWSSFNIHTTEMIVTKPGRSVSS